MRKDGRPSRKTEFPCSMKVRKDAESQNDNYIDRADENRKDLSTQSYPPFIGRGSRALFGTALLF